MWRNTRLVVLTATCASFYAAVLIPFMVVPLIPGLTHFRPANALPVVCSFMFGPAAAWGAAFGNLIGDFFGGLGPGDAFGFVGNFFYALVPYRLWRACGRDEPLPATAGGWVLLMVVIAIASMLCAAIVGFGLHLLGFVPFTILANVIVVNDFVTSAVLAPVLLAVVYPRVRKARLLYVDLAGAPRRASVARRVAGATLVTAGTVAAFVLGNLVSAGWMAPLVPTVSPRLGFVLTVLPPLAVAVTGVALL